jgi:hypothetical protein
VRETERKKDEGRREEGREGGVVKANMPFPGIED